MTSELLARGLLSGRVPKHVLICGEGESCWRWVGEIPEFLTALEERRDRQREKGAVLVDAERLDTFEDDEEEEETAVNRLPFRHSDPPPAALRRFEDVDEQTVVDTPTFDSSEPPPP